MATLLEKNQLRNHVEFRERVSAAMSAQAMYILNSTPADVVAKVKWALSSTQHLQGHIESMMAAVIGDPGIQTDLALSSDAQIEAAVAGAIPALAKGL